MLNAQTIDMRLDADLQRPFRVGLTTDNLNLHNKLTLKMKGVIKAYIEEERAVQANRALSDQGKAEQLTTAGTRALKAKEWLARVVSRLDDERRGLRTALYSIKTPIRFGTDARVQYDNGKELRERYTGLTRQARGVVFIQMSEAVAVEDPDDAESVAVAAVEQARRDEVLWAFQETPGPAMITKDIQDRALTERPKRIQPSQYAQLQQTDLMHEILGGVRDHVVLWLRGLGVDPKTIYATLGGPLPPASTTEADGRLVAA